MKKATFMPTLVLLGCSLAVSVGSVNAASFNCRRASGCVEETICNNARLSRMDSTMSSLYFRLRNGNYGAEARRLVRSQRSWLVSRESCGCDDTCLVNMYRSRIQTFRYILRN